MKKTSNYVISCLVAVAILFSITTTAFAANYNTNYSLNGDGAHDIVEVAKAQKGIGGKSGGSAFGFPAKQLNRFPAYVILPSLRPVYQMENRKSISGG